MIISRLILKNWRNFKSADIPLGRRVFLVGPNASGKSNLLDVFRFLRDIAKPGGGLQKSIIDRGGLSKIRCLSARENPLIEIEVHLSESHDQTPIWKYAIGIKQEPRGYRHPVLAYEKVSGNGEQLLSRPEDEDKTDPLRLTQTYLEQINANAKFRDIAKFFESVVYLHLIPQLLRYPEAFSKTGIAGDPFGRNFLDRVGQTAERTREQRLQKIERALRIAVPHLKELTFVRDEHGTPHLQAVYEHWRPKAGKQREDQFSDGTLRLMGLLWSLLEGDSLLLLEEPELSLNAGIVTRLPSLMHRLQREKKRQIILSTHSADLLNDRGIEADEVVLLTPTREGTEVQIVSSIQEVTDLLEAGMNIADVVLPRTAPEKVSQLELFE
jgi:predicted ATPase